MTTELSDEQLKEMRRQALAIARGRKTHLLQMIDDYEALRSFANAVQTRYGDTLETLVAVTHASQRLDRARGVRR